MDSDGINMKMTQHGRFKVLGSQQAGGLVSCLCQNAGKPSPRKNGISWDFFDLVPFEHL